MSYSEELAQALQRDELHRMQLAGIMTASIQNTRATVKDRIGRDSPYWTQAYCDVCAAVDREIKERERAEKAESVTGEARAACAEMRAFIIAVPHRPSCHLNADRPFSDKAREVFDAKGCDCGKDAALSSTCGQSLLGRLERAKKALERIVTSASDEATAKIAREALEDEAAETKVHRAYYRQVIEGLKEL